MTERKLSSRDNFLVDILKGLAVYFESTLIEDVLETARRYPKSELGFALNRNQTASKKWLTESLYRAVGGDLGRVAVLGGWYGVLAAFLLHDPRFTISRAVSMDINPDCEAIANCLNGVHWRAGTFRAVTYDMMDLTYGGDRLEGLRESGDTESFSFCPDTIINTSCEHLGDFSAWFSRLPKGRRLVLQSNDYEGIAGHVNCVRSLADFKVQAPLAEIIFDGEKKMDKYSRFMLIGMK
jgi:hypothetical protein